MIRSAGGFEESCATLELRCGEGQACPRPSGVETNGVPGRQLRIVALFLSLKANSHGRARHDADRTVLSCLTGGVNWMTKLSCRLRRCELDSRRLETVADRKFEV